MKNIFFILIIICNNVLSQTNIVVNGGFEDAINPDCSFGDNGFCPQMGSYQDIKDYWNNFPGWTYPLKKQPGLFCPKPGTSDDICSSTGYPSRTGNRLGYASSGEFFIGELSEEIQKNIFYYTEFYVRVPKNEYLDLGIRFFKEHPKQCGGNMLESSHQSSGESDVFAAPYNLIVGQYTKVSKYVIHNEKYKYFALGQHNPFSKITPIYDDVRILKLNENACPPYWKFQHTEFNSNMLFQASDYITIGENHDNTQPVGPVYFRAGSKTILKATNTINITPGIVYEPGSFVHMAIEPCGDSPCPAPIVNNSAITICNSSPVLFTQPSETGVFYSWSPTDYLDNPNSASPTFTPPNNFIGTIIYTVTATNICGQQQTAQVKVFADANPEPNPWFSIVNPSTPPYYDAYNFTVEVGMSSHTEWIKFELLKKGTNIVLNGKIYYRDVDFTCCNFNWSTTSFLPSIYNCNDYDIRITTKNYCYNNTYSQVYAWNKTTYPFNLIMFPNVFSPPNPPNEALYITATGVTSYSIKVYSGNWNQLYFSKTDNVNSSPFLVWDGKCHIGPCNGNYVATGQYKVILKLFGCNGLVYDNAQFVFVFNDNGRIGVFEDSAKIDIAKSSVPYSLFPNPSNGNVEVLFFGDTLNEKQLSIFDFTGKLVFDIRLIENYNTIDLSNLSNGIYIVVLNDGENNYKEKLVIAK